MEAKLPPPPTEQKSFKQETATALYDYLPLASDQLPFKKGDVINIFDKTEEGWMGELNGKKGEVPSNYVKLNNEKAGRDRRDKNESRIPRSLSISGWIGELKREAPSNYVKLNKADPDRRDKKESKKESGISKSSSMNKRALSQKTPHAKKINSNPLPTQSKSSRTTHKISMDGEEEYMAGNRFYITCQYQKALPHFEQAATKKYPAAYLRLGCIYRDGEGISKDKIKGESYFRKINIEWFKKQAESADAQFNLGLCYYYGLGVLQEAVKYFRQAAEQGYAIALHWLGFSYDNGQGVAQDYTLAVEYYQPAAVKGYAGSQSALGDCYAKGKGVPQDYNMAKRYYELAAIQGYATGQNNLGAYYFSVAQDYNEAARHFQSAADQGEASAQQNIGACYFSGQGVRQDYKVAAGYFLLSANQGEAAGQNWLGFCYENGYGVEKDEKKANHYYRLAANQGNEAAKTALSRRRANSKYFIQSSRAPSAFFPGLPSHEKGSRSDESFESESSSLRK